MLYLYQADTWCESCGGKIRTDNHCPGDPADEYSYNSDDWPKGPFPPEATDAPEHCAAGPECLERVDLADFDSSGLLSGASDSMRFVGAVLNAELTEHGVEYTKHMMMDPTTSRRHIALWRLWRECYSQLQNRAECCTGVEPCAECG